MVEKLVIVLDTGSVLNLAKCHQLTLDLLNSGTSVWNKLVKRACPESVRINLGHIRPPRVMSDRTMMTGVLVQERAEMANLIAILKMLEDPKACLLAILDLICQRFASYEEEHRLGTVEGNGNEDEDDNDLNMFEAYPAQLVQVVDSRNQPCSVSLLGFWILQEIEENFGGGLEVKIEGIMIDHLEEPWLTFLSLRHQEVMVKFDTHTIRCESRVDVEMISSLLHQHQNLKMEWLEVKGEIGPEGWTALARAMQARPGVVRHIETNRGALFGPLGGPYNGATEEDLRAIWVQLMPRGNMVVQSSCKQWFSDFFDRDGDGGEETWRDLLGWSRQNPAFCCEHCMPIL